MRNSRKFLRSLFLMTLFCLLVVSFEAFAQEAEIFDTLQYKLYTTLKDLREIVYVVSGFGLVMFSVAAIFNKISYKHLGYIMVGLSLLSLMFPFLEYFSGDDYFSKKEDAQLTFQNYLESKPYSRGQAIGTDPADITDPNYKGETPSLPGELTDADIDAMMAELMLEEEWERQRLESEFYREGGLNNLPDTIKVGGIDVQSSDFAKMIQAGCSPSSTMSKSKWGENGIRNVCTVDQNGGVHFTTEACQGKVENGVCEKTAWQKLGDVWSTIGNVVGAYNTASAGFNSAVDAVANAAWGIQHSGEILGSDASFLAKLHDLMGTIGSSSNGVESGLAGILGALRGISGSVDATATTWSTDYENNPTGENSVSNTTDKINEGLTKAGTGLANAGSVVNQGVNAGYSVYSTGQSIGISNATFQNAMERLGRIFGH